MNLTSHRRILTFPAIHPLPSASAGELIDGLLLLARSVVAFSSRRFVLHRRCARELIREIGSILVFLEDVRGRGVAVPGSATVSLAELHVTFQKARCLVEDCDRPDARLWVLARSERVTSEFRALIRTIATALDVLPLEAIDADPETKELMRLIREQAWRVPVEIDPDDARALRSVWSAFRRFEDGIPPSDRDLKSVLDHLRIRTWMDCIEESAFLEELFFASLEDHEHEKDASLISSLKGFMDYCRVVLFDVNATSGKFMVCRNDAESALGDLNDENLLCPISFDLMTDPVTIATGHTYDRASIVRWLEAGHHNCPVTGKRLTSTKMVSNAAVKNIVRHFCQMRNIRIPKGKTKRNLNKTTLPLNSVAAGATKMAASFLVDKLAYWTDPQKIKAACEIRMLSQSSIFNKTCLVEAGAVPWLLHLMSSYDPLLQEKSVAALLSLSKHAKAQAAIVGSDGLCLIVEVLQSRSMATAKARQHAVGILCGLSTVEDYKTAIGGVPEAITALVELLKEGTKEGKKAAVLTLYALLIDDSNHPKVLSAGAIPALAGLLSCEREELVNDAVGVLAKVANRCEGATAIMGASIVPKLVELLQTSTSKTGREYCVSVLLSLCNYGGARVVSYLQQMPLLVRPLYSISVESTSKAGKKARLLLSHIHNIREDDEQHAVMAPARAQERIIRAQ